MRRGVRLLMGLGLMAASAGDLSPLWAQTPPSSGKSADKETSINVKFDEQIEGDRPQEGGVFTYAPPIEMLFQNPAIASGIASGADAINRSVESLMDSLFYSVLDNEKNFYITDEAWFTTNLKRDVFSTPSGAYVVMDRFQLGPRFAKELWRIHNVPISLGIDGTVEVLQIYLRTDGLRVAEQQELSPLRRWINNWFGLLPLASVVLPPSFNQNELYDPVTQLKTPFTFPLDQEGFYSMPVGSIRSYAISGGIQVPFDLGGAQGQITREALDNAFGMDMAIPYSVFRQGEHRINVLRRGEHSAWVGVKDLKRLGHSLSPLLGTKYYVFHAALAAKLFDWDWIWQGVPIAVLPININFEQAVADLFDQVYEYDMQNPAARDAYEAAVKGDFVPSRLRYLDAKEKGLDTGVAFHFARLQDRQENLSSNGPNVAVYKRERARDHHESEIEITDTEGKFYVLESSLAVEDKTWDVLVGDEQGRVQQTVEMKVRRVLQDAVATTSDAGPWRQPDEPSTAPERETPPQEKPEAIEATDGGETVDATPPDASAPSEGEKRAYTYAFEAVPDPYRLNMSLNIQDRYLDAVEYERYLEELRFFTGLDLETVPKMNRTDPELDEERRRVAYFVEPTDAVRTLHVTPTYLGRFGAQATMTFSAQQIDKILAASEDEIWAAFARAYGMDELAWGNAAVRASAGHQLQWVTAFLLYPIRLFNARLASVDAIKEATQAVNALVAIKQALPPLDKREAFFSLLDTDYPRHLARALLELADPAEVPRHVIFSAQPKGAARQEVKAAYGKLNNMTFRAGPAFPEPSRYSRAQAKLANFYLDQPREAASRPQLTSIDVKSRAVPASVRSLETELLEEEVGGGGKQTAAEAKLDRDTKHVFIEVGAKGLPATATAKVYVRVEQAGRIKIGKLELAERVLDLTPVIAASSDGVATYQFFLTGPLSPLTTFMLNQAVGSGDEFLVTLAVSRDGAIWSDERTVEFRFERGQLSPPK